MASLTEIPIPSCAERVKRSRPKTAILREACWEGWSSVGIWELGFLEGSHHSQNDQSGSQGQSCVCRQCGLCFFFRESGMLVHARQKVLTWPAPNKNLSQMSFPGRQHYRCFHNLLLEELSMCSISTGRRHISQATPSTVARHCFCSEFCTLHLFPLLILHILLLG